MFYASDLATLISIWLGRMDNPSLPDAYRDALSDCTYELINLVNKGINDELNALSPTQQEQDNEQEFLRQTAG
jgi:hypothetical protein